MASGSGTGKAPRALRKFVDGRMATADEVVADVLDPNQVPEVDPERLGATAERVTRKQAEEVSVETPVRLKSYKLKGFLEKRTKKS